MPDTLQVLCGITIETTTRQMQGHPHDSDSPMYMNHSVTIADDARTTDLVTFTFVSRDISLEKETTFIADDYTPPIRHSLASQIGKSPLDTANFYFTNFNGRYLLRPIDCD
ncbi:hypothetical protein NPIL_340121 [Nephila pilipes]|uniref:Uncharacterized protein n=1 Tax=Nephila pilipes TaxID=299642 RepID=A0A8X6RA06_NEPPI|nr:hypothetical protein NPIL_340121 [Nephila pilipes]